MTVSIGCLSRKVDNFSPELSAELFQQIDKALYQAKKSGRNRCMYANYDASSNSYLIS